MTDPERITVLIPCEAGEGIGPFYDLNAAVLWADRHEGRDAYTILTVAHPMVVHRRGLKLVDAVGLNVESNVNRGG